MNTPSNEPTLALPLGNARKLDESLRNSGQEIARLQTLLSSVKTPSTSAGTQAAQVSRELAQLGSQLSQLKQAKKAPEQEAALQQTLDSYEGLLLEFIAKQEEEKIRYVAKTAELDQKRQEFLGILSRKNREIEQLERLQRASEMKSESSSSSRLQRFVSATDTNTEQQSESADPLARTRAKNLENLRQDVYYTHKRLLTLLTSAEFRFRGPVTITEQHLSAANEWIEQFSVDAHEDLQKKQTELDLLISQKKAELVAFQSQKNSLAQSPAPMPQINERLQQTATQAADLLVRYPEVGQVTAQVLKALDVLKQHIQQQIQWLRSAHKHKAAPEELEKLNRELAEAQASAARMELNLEEILRRLKGNGDRAQRIVEAAEELMRRERKLRDRLLLEHQEEKKKLENELQEEKRRGKKQKRKAENAQTEAKNKDDENSALRNDQNELRRRCDDLSKRAEQLERELRDARNQVAQLQAAGQSGDNIYRVLQYLLEDRRPVLENNSQALLSWLQSELSQARAAEQRRAEELARVQEELRRLERELMFSKMKEGNEQQEINRLRERIAELTQALANANQAKPESPGQNYMPALMELLRILGRLPDQLKNTRSKEEQLLERAETAEEQSNQYLQSVQERDSQLDVLNQQLNSLRLALGALQEQLEQERESNQQLTGRLNQLQAENQHLESQRDEAMDQNGRLRSLVAELNRRIEELMAALEQQKGILHQAESDRDQARQERDVAVAARDEAIDERDKARTQREQAIEDRDKAKRKAEDAENERKDEEGRKKLALEQRNQARKDQKKADEEKNTAEQALKKLAEQLQQLTQEKQKTETSRNESQQDHERQIAALRKEISRLKNALGRESAEKGRLGEMLRRADHAHEDATNTLEKFRSDAQRAQRELQLSRAVNNRLSEENESLKEELRRLRAELEAKPSAPVLRLLPAGDTQPMRSVPEQKETRKFHEVLRTTLSISRTLQLNSGYTMRLLAALAPDPKMLREVLIKANSSISGNEFQAQSLLFGDQNGADMLSAFIRDLPNETITYHDKPLLEAVFQALELGFRDQKTAKYAQGANLQNWRYRNYQTICIAEPPRLNLHHLLSSKLSREEMREFQEKLDRRDPANFLAMSPEAFNVVVEVFLGDVKSRYPEPLQTLKSVRMQLWQKGEGKLLNSPQEVDLIKKELKRA